MRDTSKYIYYSRKRLDAYTKRAKLKRMYRRTYRYRARIKRYVPARFRWLFINTNIAHLFPVGWPGRVPFIIVWDQSEEII